MSDLGVLLPLRIETRFKNGDLWIRVIPDEPWFLREDQRITEDELLALRRYTGAAQDVAADGVPTAWRSLAAQVGPARAVFLHRRFVTTLSNGLLAVRTPADQELRTEPLLPRVADFPSELVVWLAERGGAFRSVLRLTVNRARLLADFADPDIPGDRRWWEDWDEAVAIGTAGIVPAANLPGSIDALFVTGLGDGDPAEHFAALVAEGRIGLLEPGTPTNSVDGAPAAPLAGDAGTWWGILQSPPGDADLDVSRAITGDPQLLGNMPGGERPQRAPASALVTAMWPALWGFAAGHVFDVMRGPAPAQWAGRALFPEGAYPTVRIGPQPYGLLPATALKAWQPAAGDPSFEPAAIAALIRLRDGHARSARARGNAAGQTTEGLLDLISDTPTSSRFRFRAAWPLELWWLGMTGAGVAPSWRTFSKAWSTTHSLAGEIGLRPVRRYGARGTSRPVTLPLVVPGGTRPQAVPGLLGKLGVAAVTNPAAFVNTRNIEARILSLQGSSLLIRLAIRSLQLAIADVVRDRDRLTSADPEPFSRNNRQAGTLQQLIARATPIDPASPNLTAATRHLLDITAALRSIGDVPIRSLERMLAATIDCANHRIDAWCLAPVQRRLDDLIDDPTTTRRLGAYGWVDRLVPGTPGPTSAGLLHAPSPSAALAAAVLRDRAVSEGGHRWDLDITSRSARTAERLAQHVRIGAHLAEALGREVERILGRAGAIEQLRRDFPVRIEHAGKRVCDGLRVLAQDPFPVAINPDQRARLQELRDGLDSYGDLLVADAVHHLVEGRSDVAGAIMNAAAGFERPPEMSLLRTPREGRALSTSVVLALTHVAEQPLPDSSADLALMPPASTLDPSVAAFLETQAGGPQSWTFDVSLTVGTASPQLRTVRLTDLGLRPAEALSLTLARLEQLAILRAAEITGVDLEPEGFSGAIVGGIASSRYDLAVRVVGIVGRNPLGSAPLSEEVGGANASDSGVEASLLARYLKTRDVCAALVRNLREQIARLTPGGAIGSADPAVFRRLSQACTRWGIAPDPPRRPIDPAQPPVTAGQRRRHRLIDAAVMSLRMLEQRLTLAPDATTVSRLQRDEFLDAAAALVSPTGQVALTGTATASAVPAVTRAGGERGLDASWLTIVAAVRPALARLEAHQLERVGPAAAVDEPCHRPVADRSSRYAPDDRPLRRPRAGLRDDGASVAGGSGHRRSLQRSRSGRGDVHRIRVRIRCAGVARAASHSARGAAGDQHTARSRDARARADRDAGARARTDGAARRSRSAVLGTRADRPAAGVGRHGYKARGARMIFDVMLRLEADPHQQDLARGWAAELADPVWFLGRQWQMGEHQAEDASSPVAVEIVARATPIGAVAGQPHLDPASVPAETIVESEPFDWWTAGRRVRVGRAVAASAASNGVTLPADDSLRLGDLPVPFDLLNGTGLDGRVLWQRRIALGLDEAWFGEPGPPRNEPVDLWDPAELSYTASLPAGNTSLVINRHDGGDLDWYSADAARPLATAGVAPTRIRTTPGRLNYPSAPLPRWWQIENAKVSIGGQAPDRAQLATLVLIDLIVNHSNDWFTYGVPARAGEIVTFSEVTVIDSFGDKWPLTPPSDWSLFRTAGLDPRSLVLWATARTPLVGPILDEVVIGIDEDANLVWAVEQIVAGRTLPTPPAPVPAPSTADTGARQTFSYLPMTPIPPYWHPYVVGNVNNRRRFVQGRAADLSGRVPTLLPPPVSDLLVDPRGGNGRPVHQLEPAAIPADGLRVERRAMLARSTKGEPLLWTQRRRQPLLTPPAFALRFDILQPSEVS